MSPARRRLQAIQNALTYPQDNTNSSLPDVLVLPDGKKVTFVISDSTQILVDNVLVCVYRALEHTVALTINGIGTPDEHTATHVPRYPVLEISSNSMITLADMWSIIYAIFTRHHTQETIPLVLAPDITNNADICAYILRSGLGRTAPGGGDETSQILFLMRTAFWQGAGTHGYHTRGWLHSPSTGPTYATSPFPAVQSFTRTSLVITAHPLRPPKPCPGEVLYRRYCPTVKQVLEFTYFDPGSDTDPNTPSPHLAAFHRWHNDERVSKGWNERGTLEQHRAYVRRVMHDPAILPVMMSWDGELMGYTEIVWLKENHAATFVPHGVGEWDRGIHVLTGEEKFRGWERAQAWLRSLHHYCFLADPRTEHVFGEPKADNAAIIQVSLDATMHIETIFDFPYKRSVLTCMPRERFFKLDVL